MSDDLPRRVEALEHQAYPTSGLPIGRAIKEAEENVDHFALRLDLPPEPLDPVGQSNDVVSDVGAVRHGVDIGASVNASGGEIGSREDCGCSVEGVVGAHARTLSARAQAQAAMWASLAKAARTAAELDAYALGTSLGLLRDPDLTAHERHYLADLIDRDLNGWAS